jgi:hypothetical protein
VTVTIRRTSRVNVNGIPDVCDSEPEPLPEQIATYNQPVEPLENWKRIRLANGKVFYQDCYGNHKREADYMASIALQDDDESEFYDEEHQTRISTRSIPTRSGRNKDVIVTPDDNGRGRRYSARNSNTRTGVDSVALEEAKRKGYIYSEQKQQQMQVASVDKKPSLLLLILRSYKKMPGWIQFMLAGLTCLIIWQAVNLASTAVTTLENRWNYGPSMTAIATYQSSDGTIWDVEASDKYGHLVIWEIPHNSQPAKPIFSDKPLPGTSDQNVYIISFEKQEGKTLTLDIGEGAKVTLYEQPDHTLGTNPPNK